MLNVNAHFKFPIDNKQKKEIRIINICITILNNTVIISILKCA